MRITLALVVGGLIMAGAWLLSCEDRQMPDQIEEPAAMAGDRPTDIASATASLDGDRIISAEARNWLAHGKTYDESRFSQLDQINSDNVSELGLAWYFDTGTDRGLEASPIVVDGVMFTSGSWSLVFANDARTGELIWQYDPEVPIEPINRAFTKVVMVVQYLDDAGRRYTSWLGEIDADFLGCYVKPSEIDEVEHGDLRLEYKDYTSHAAVNIEGLTINKITNMSKELPGMHLCSFKEESSRSIIYHSAKSSLDDSDYLSMIFLRGIGGEESLRSALELVCHAPDIEKSSELKDELMSHLKSKLLESNGRLV